MESRILRNKQRLTLEVNGKIVSPVAYMTYHPAREQYEDFQKIGTQLFSVGVYLGDQGINSISGIRPFRPSLWKGEGKYDFSAVDEDLARIFPTGREGFVIPRVYLDCPLWWEEGHPEELCRDWAGNSLRQSFASQRWRKETAEVLCALIDHVEASPWQENVIGWQVAAGGTEEWAYHRRRDFPAQYSDYSAPAQKAWHTWLERKYGEIGALNHAWRTQYGSFSEVAVPSPLEREFSWGGVLRDPMAEENAVDFYQYHSFLIADTILYFCRLVKEHTRRRCITGAFYGYLMEIMHADVGHLSLRQVLESPDIDFLASPNSYFDCRGAGIDWPFMSLVDSARLHGKLWFVESDTRTHLTRPMKETMPESDSGNGYYQWEGAWRGPETRELSLALLEKGFGKILTGQVGTWWFDMWGGWYQDPAYMDFLTNAGRIMEEQERDPAESTAEIAVFVDGMSYSYFSLNAPELGQLVYRQRKALGLMGAPYHLYQPDDLLREDFDVGRYKLAIFLNCVRMEEETVRAVAQKLQKDGKTLVWVFLEDRFDGEGHLKENPVTDFSVSYDPGAPADQAEYQGQAFPEVPVVCPRVAQKSGDRVLARFRQSGEPAVLVRPQRGYTSVYSAAPHLPARLLMELAGLSGVHLYSVTEDVVYADSRFICIHAARDGWKRLYLPEPAVFCDAWTGEEKTGRVRFVDFYMKAYETRTFRLRR